MTPSVAVPGDTDPSDATGALSTALGSWSWMHGRAANAASVRTVPQKYSGNK